MATVAARDAREERPVNELGTMQDAKTALVVEGQLTEKVIEVFKGSTEVKRLKIPK
jgi:hypothetical protein